MSEWAWVVVGFLIAFGSLVGYTIKLIVHSAAIRRERERHK
ncbi:hypothetical protein [Amycolatopsis thermoflava]